MQTLVVELTNIHTFKILKDLESAKLLKIKNEQPDSKAKLSKKQKEFVYDLKQSLNEVDKHLNGEIELPSIDKIINEL
ncbi:MAG: hypothetical protein SFY32_01765 [Bacteroidota bacterium]|nr:hypothetical protein [Bacteroidota bacterium]